MQLLAAVKVSLVRVIGVGVAIWPKATVKQTWSKRKCVNGDVAVQNVAFVTGLWKKVCPANEATDSRWCVSAPTPAGVAVFQEKLEVSDSAF